MLHRQLHVALRKKLTSDNVRIHIDPQNTNLRAVGAPMLSTLQNPSMKYDPPLVPESRLTHDFTTVALLC